VIGRIAMKVGLYSITYGGVWYKGRALTVEEVFERAKRLGFDGVEIDGKRPHGFPLDWDESRRRTIRKMAKDMGLEIVGVAGNNNFVSPFDEDREMELLMLAEQVRLCADLGGKVVRVFMTWNKITRDADGRGNYDIPAKYSIRGIGPDATMIQRWRWARECLSEGAAIAKRQGVTLALQNHHPFLMHSKKPYMDMLDMVREVGSDALKCSLDAGLLVDQTDGGVACAVRETGALQVISHCFGEWKRDGSGKPVMTELRGGDWPDINYPAFVGALKETGFDGYLDFEYCHHVLDEKHNVVGVERVDEQAQLALEYLRGLIGKK
jgi:sugar phosphate isomerase/epimerase